MEHRNQDDDSEALFACAEHGGALCTVTAIDGSWSRRLGAQLAVLPDGATRGSLADGCLERALAEEALQGGAARVLRYGQGSPFVDIRLPCGSGVEVLIDPAPNRAAIQAATAALTARCPASLNAGMTPHGPFIRHYLPPLRLMVLGSGPEVTALARLAAAQGIGCTLAGPRGEAEVGLSLGGQSLGGLSLGGLSLGQAPDLAVDAWTAIAVLFHDHEWERGILPWALASPAFHVGAQGGKGAREARSEWLEPAAMARLRSPIGLFPGARTPSVLALSVLSEIVAAYEGLL